MSVSVQLSVGQFPDGACFEGVQSYANRLFALATGILPGNFNGVIISSSAPAVQDQDRLWVRTDSSGRPIGIFLFLGSWLWPISSPANSPERRIWTGSEASVWSFDGGDGTDPGVTPPTIVSGASWKVDHAFDFRVPVGAGQNTVPYDTNPVSTIAVGATQTNAGLVGEERHMLSNQEMMHTHLIINPDTIDNQADGTPAGNILDATNYLCYWIKHSSDHTTMFQAHGSTTLPNQGVTSGPNGINPTSTPVSQQNMQPFVGVYYIQRTSRQFYTAS